MAENTEDLRAEVQRLRTLAVATTDRKALAAIRELIEDLERRSQTLE